MSTVKPLPHYLCMGLALCPSADAIPTEIPGCVRASPRLSHF